MPLQAKILQLKEPNPNPMVIRFDNVNLKNGIAHYNILSVLTTPDVFNAVATLMYMI